ncbi:uncharacterized protein ARMOST_00004 [Armillaria ostoyae]|uniref:Uncharacterized protein n=1 Tax=Armillaria ostoyae TaxID=47428 RepID=A0A284QJX7_ARMOS|nr:uncharacterized protein ARMOST_00004 [Armillaria ostoyae]
MSDAVRTESVKLKVYTLTSVLITIAIDENCSYRSSIGSEGFDSLETARTPLKTHVTLDQATYHKTVFVQSMPIARRRLPLSGY